MPDLTITGPDESNIHGRLLEDVFVADETNIVSEYLTLDGDGATRDHGNHCQRGECCLWRIQLLYPRPARARYS